MKNLDCFLKGDDKFNYQVKDLDPFAKKVQKEILENNKKYEKEYAKILEAEYQFNAKWNKK